MGGVNYRLLRLRVSAQAENVILPKIKPLIKQEFDSRKAQMLTEFDQHGVTRELKEGAADPTSSSAYVDTRKGGNLYSFIGFDHGTDPTEAVREAIDEQVKLNASQITREIKVDGSIIFKTPVRIPNIETVNEKVAERAPVPWMPRRAFTDMIERGITGFNKYLFDATRVFKTSRSGPAIQVEHAVRQGSARPIRYVSQILANFKDLISGK
jgi:hypothetical protein